MAEIPVGGQPQGVTFSPDSRRAYVSNRLDDSVSVIDVASRKVVRHDTGRQTSRTGCSPTVAEKCSTCSIRRRRAFRSSTPSRSRKSSGCRPAAGHGRWPSRPTASRMVVTNSLSRFVKVPDAAALGGDRARPRPSRGRRPRLVPRSEPVAGRSVAPQRQVCPDHAHAQQEPRAHDPGGAEAGH